MKFHYLFYTIIFLFSCICLQAQEKVTISGKIVDAETKQPLPFASIGIKGKSITTVSNLQGEFDFHVPYEYTDETFVISMLGYVNIERSIINLLNQDSLVFPMIKAVQMLDEVVIQDSLSGEDIVRIALSRIEQNYAQQPYLLDGFYRDLKKMGGVYFSILEAAVKIYDEDYKEPRNKTRLRERVALTEVRKSLGYDNKFTTYFDQTNLLEDLLLKNPVKYRKFSDNEEFFKSLRRVTNSYYNGHKVYVVKLNQGQKLILYIDTETYAFIRIENEVEYSNFILKRKKNLYSKFEYEKLILDFKEYKGKMYPHYMNLLTKINWYDMKDSVLKFETELLQELLINEVHQDPDERITGLEKMRKYGLQYQDLPYNKEFWENYNVIKQTPLDKEIVKDLERQGALPEGMEDN